MTTNIFVIVGSAPINSPKAIPTKETCDKVSAIKDCLLRIKNKPKMGAIIEIKIDAWKALCMNP